MRALAVLFSLLLLPFQLQQAYAQTTLLDDCLKPEDACRSVRSCVQPSVEAPTRDCRKCLLRAPNLFGTGGHCIQMGNDPYCEAKKAAERAVAENARAARQLDCERLKSLEIAECHARLDAQVLACEAEKNASGSSEQQGIAGLLLNAGDREYVLLPDEVRLSDAVVALVEQSSYSQLELIRIVPRLEGDFVPVYAKKDSFGFTVGEYIFVDSLEEVRDQPIRFWLTQIEVSRLFADYGLENFSSVYSENTSVFDDLIEKKIADICAKHPCD